MSKISRLLKKLVGKGSRVFSGYNSNRIKGLYLVLLFNIFLFNLFLIIKKI